MQQIKDPENKRLIGKKYYNFIIIYYLLFIILFYSIIILFYFIILLFFLQFQYSSLCIVSGNWWVNL